MASATIFLGLMFLLPPMLLLEAIELNVGGKDGWILKHSPGYYNHWAQSNRFQVNDTLHFKYNKGNDSVLVVNKEDYDSCNINIPKQKMDGGDSSFKLRESGLYFFISGNVGNCKHGQKLIVLVMAVRHQHHPIAAASPPSQAPASSLSPPKIHSSTLDTPVPSPSNACVGVSEGFVRVMIWIVLMYVGLVY